jgi:uncharacterized protein DUF1579
MKFRFVCLALLLVMAIPVFAADKKNPADRPCSTGNYRLMDFWIGEWDVAWPAKDGQPEGHGTNKVTRALDNCVIVENFSGEQALPLRGMSVSMYDQKSDTWKQTWVDNTGAYLDFTGHYANDVMTFERDAVSKEGKPVKQRMVYKNVKESEFDWSFDRSEDGGQTWAVVWPIHYVKLSEAKKRAKTQDSKPWWKQW